MEDKTFGLKNKNKSVKVQKCVQRAAAALPATPRRALQRPRSAACARDLAPR
jgi:hypothetical protein